MGISFHRLDLMGIHQDARWRGFDPSLQDGFVERKLHRREVEAILQYPIYQQEWTSCSRALDRFGRVREERRIEGNRLQQEVTGLLFPPSYRSMAYFYVSHSLKSKITLLKCQMLVD